VEKVGGTHRELLTLCSIGYSHFNSADRKSHCVTEALHAKTSCGGAARCIRHRESGNAMPSTQSVRTVQTAAYSLLDLEKKPPPVYKGHNNLRVLLEAFMALHEIGV
jgi:hypothetical protein